jgi:hypothetical protein
MFVAALRSLGISKQRMSLSIRLHTGIDPRAALRFWREATGIQSMRMIPIQVIKGKKKGKLPYGMCRVRVSAGIRERLLLQTMIRIIGEDAARRVVSNP